MKRTHLMQLNLFRMIAALLLLTMLTACAPSAVAPVETGGAQPANENAFTQTRLVQHAMGESAVPANPQRVVVLDSGELDAVLTLGIKPVGSFTLFEGSNFLSYLHDQMAGVEAAGTISQPDLEAIAALQPDLILSNKTRHEEIYDELSAIAPTVFAEAVGFPWQQNFLLYAAALGKQTEAETVVAAYHARLADFKTRMGDRLATQVSVIRVVENGVRILQRNMYIGVILADAGLARPPAQDVDDRFQLVSFEQIPEMDGDVIFVSYYGQDDSAYQKLLTQPLWQANKAVAAGKAFPVNDDIWHVGLGYTAANLVIDDLWRNLLGEEPPAQSASGQPAAAVEESAATVETSADCAEGFRMFDHALLATDPICIPSDPQRMAFIDGTIADAIALGVDTVTRHYYFDALLGDFPSLVDEAIFNQMTDIGNTWELNPESLILTRPDLIVTSTWWAEPNAQIQSIAPTVIFDHDRAVSWVDSFDAVAHDRAGKFYQLETISAQHGQTARTQRAGRATVGRL
jgi:iron complex transport system substrate-binding protein